MILLISLEGKSLTKDYFFKYINGKKVGFCGIGRTNMPLIDLFIKHGAIVSARDRREDAGEYGAELLEKGVKLHLGESYLDEVYEDILFRTPGIPWFLPQLVTARENGCVVTSELEIFLDICPCKTYGITGSDGKTTTTNLVARFFEEDGKTVHLGGNIGNPLLNNIDKIREDDVAIVELSSFQLISMRKSPDVCVVTNMSPNHLDVHKDMTEYIEAKKHVLLHQNAFSKAVLNFDNEITLGFKDEIRGDLMFFSRKEEVKRGAHYKDAKIFVNGEFFMDRCDLKLQGEHNVENFMAAILAVWGDVSPASIKTVAKSFNGVAHRAEFVREFEGVKYYNDSIASSPSRAISGTLSLYDKKIIMIAGGADKGVAFNELAEKICEKVGVLILVKPESTIEGFKAPAAEKIRQSVLNAVAYKEGEPLIVTVNDMQSAVSTARKMAKNGDIVSLCPSCTAFDMYRDFEVRGNHYKEIILGL